MPPITACCESRDNKDSSHVCGDIARTDTVDLDVVLAPFIAEGFGQLAECPFCSGVRRDRETTLKGHEGAKVDHFSPAQRNHVATGCL